MSHLCGLVASGVLASPFPYCDIVTTTPYKTFRGPQGALIFFRRKFEASINATVFPRYQCGTSYRSIVAMSVALLQARTEEYRREQQLFVDTSTAIAQQLLHKGYTLLTAGTDCHMMVVNLRDQGVSGFEVERVLELVSIICNQNAIADDCGVSFTGLRLATPPMVIRGMDVGDCAYAANLIHRGIELTRALDQQCPGTGWRSRKKFADFLASQLTHPPLVELKNDIETFAARFPLPPYLNSGWMVDSRA